MTEFWGDPDSHLDKPWSCLVPDLSHVKQAMWHCCTIIASLLSMLQDRLDQVLMKQRPSHEQVLSILVPDLIHPWASLVLQLQKHYMSLEQSSSQTCPSFEEALDNTWTSFGQKLCHVQATLEKPLSQSCTNITPVLSKVWNILNQVLRKHWPTLEQALSNTCDCHKPPMSTACVKVREHRVSLEHALRQLL